jgi:hypothetical protein
MMTHIESTWECPTPEDARCRCPPAPRYVQASRPYPTLQACLDDLAAASTAQPDRFPESHGTVPVRDRVYHETQRFFCVPAALDPQSLREVRP